MTRLAPCFETCETIIQNGVQLCSLNAVYMSDVDLSLVHSPGPFVVLCVLFQLNNYIVRSYRDVIVVTKIATRKSSKALSSHVIKQKTY